MELSGAGLESFFVTVLPHLGERQRRVVVGAIAEALGRGGQVRVVEASGMSSNTVYKAVQEVRGGVEPSDRQRSAGGGDKPTSISSRVFWRRSTRWCGPRRVAIRCRRCGGR